MGGGVEVSLASLVAGGHGQQDGAAAFGGQRDAPEGEEELEAQLGAGSGQAHGHRPGAGAVTGGQGGEVDLVDFVVEEESPVGLVEDVEGLGEGVGLLAFEGELFGAVERGVVDDAVGVAASDALVAQMGVEPVACRDDGVGT